MILPWVFILVIVFKESCAMVTIKFMAANMNSSTITLFFIIIIGLLIIGKLTYNWQFFKFIYYIFYLIFSWANGDFLLNYLFV